MTEQTSRQRLIQRAREVIDYETDAAPHAGLPHTSYLDADIFARRLVDALLPQITEPSQLADIPDGSLILLEAGNGPKIYTWRKGRLCVPHAPTMSFLPGYVLTFGPLTVVYQP